MAGATALFRTLALRRLLLLGPTGHLLSAAGVAPCRGWLAVSTLFCGRSRDLLELLQVDQDVLCFLSQGVVHCLPVLEIFSEADFRLRFPS